MGELVISLADLAFMEAAALEAWPREACGLLVGPGLGAAAGSGWLATGTTLEAEAGLTVIRVVPSPNRAPGGLQDRFEIDPALLLRVQREARAGAERILGVYHSHPNGKAQLSPTDRASAWVPGFVWLIIALHKGAVVDRGAFLHLAGDGEPADARFAPLAIRVLGG